MNQATRPSHTFEGAEELYEPVPSLGVGDVFDTSGCVAARRRAALQCAAWPRACFGIRRRTRRWCAALDKQR